MFVHTLDGRSIISTRRLAARCSIFRTCCNQHETLKPSQEEPPLGVAGLVVLSICICLSRTLLGFLSCFLTVPPFRVFYRNKEHRSHSLGPLILSPLVSVPFPRLRLVFIGFPGAYRFVAFDVWPCFFCGVGKLFWFFSFLGCKQESVVFRCGFRFALFNF